MGQHNSAYSTCLSVAANIDVQSPGVARRDKSRGVLVTVGVNIIIRESIATAVNLELVDETAVVAGWVCLVVAVCLERRLNIATSNKESRADKGGTETGDDGKVDVVLVANLAKGTAVTTPDVTSGRLDIISVVTVADHSVVADVALDIAARGLGVDGQGLGGILPPDLVGIGVPVSGKGVGIDGLEVGGGQDSDRSAVRTGDAH